MYAQGYMTQVSFAAQTRVPTYLAGYVSWFGCYEADDWLLGEKGLDMCHTSVTSNVTNFCQKCFKWFVSSLMMSETTD